MRLNADELEAEVKAYKAANPPDFRSQLQWLRPTILGFYLDGYSKKSTYEFLKGAGLIQCSQLAFYRWLAKHMDLEAEGRTHVAATLLQASERATPAKPAQQGSAAAAIVSHAKQSSPVPSGEPSGGASLQSAENVDATVSDESHPGDVSHAKRVSEPQSNVSGPGGSSESAPPDSPVLHAKRGDPEPETNGTQGRATPAETAQQEGASAKPASEASALPVPSASSCESSLSTTQETSVKSTLGKAPISDEKRRQLVEFARQQVKELERNDMGAIADRALARLNQRDRNGGREG